MNYSRRDFVKTLFAATPAYLAASAMNPNLYSIEVPPPQTGSLNFLVLGDWGGAKPEHIQAQNQVAYQMAQSAKSLGAKFVLNVGDNFYEDGVSSVDDPQWKSKFEDVYKAAPLQIPWFSLLGNHDYHDNVGAQLAYSKKNPLWMMPARYYSFSQKLADQTSVDFFCLDTSVFIKNYLKDDVQKKHRGENVRAQQFEVPTQIKWLESGLANSKADWKIVVGHHPIYSSSVDQDQHDMIEMIYPILTQHHVPVYFNGHDHNLQHLVAGQLNMFDSGAGSHHYKVKPNAETKFARDSQGYATAQLTKDRLQVTLIDNLGTALYSASIARS